MQTIRIFLVLLLVVLMLPCTHAQIGSNAPYSEPTKYGGGATEDVIFFYADINSAMLTAPSDGNSYDFYWYSYSASNSSFSTLEQTDLNTTSSSLINIAENGYKLSIRSGATTVDEYYCWNFEPVAQVDSVGFPPGSASCNNLRVTAHTKNKLLTYYKHKSDNSPVNVDYGYEWSSSPTGPMADVTEYSAMIDAPVEDTDYTVVVGGKFSPGIPSAEASKSYNAIAVEARFSFETEGTADNEAKEGSAPLVVRFTDESKGKVTDWEWTFGDAGKDFIPDPIFTFQKYNEDGNGYPVVLTVRNLDSGCESESSPEVFTVKEMIISAANAFTPFSSPGENDEFRVFYRSVKKFNIVIYNRWGRKVYQSNNPEVGWNGRIGSRKAEPGVYFYKIEAEGFKGEKEALEGAVHLIITNN